MASVSKHVFPYLEQDCDRWDATDSAAGIFP